MAKSAQQQILILGYCQNLFGVPTVEEQRLLKQLLQDYSDIELCAALQVARKSGVQKLKYVLENVSDYVSSCKYPAIQFLVSQSDSEDIKKRWQRLMVLEGKWFPGAADKEEYTMLAKILGDWATKERLVFLRKYQHD